VAHPFRKLKHALSGGGWHPETFVCSRRGHVLPAAQVALLRPVDGGVGVDLPDGRRLARCLRCDSWREVPVPAVPRSETLPPLSQIALPRRGRALRDAITIRAIAIERFVHVAIFGLLFGVALLVRLNIGPLRNEAQFILSALQSAAGNSGAGGSHGFIVRELQNLLDLRSGTLNILMFTALAYFVVELIEAIGLWHEKRWAEYLTVIATAGLMPFEILELSRKVTVIRVGALVVNLAIVVWLVWRKRLFGLNGGHAAAAPDVVDPAELLAAPPEPVGARPPLERNVS
jgi:uncharacterized membrane protein (DUF2068 family)